MSGSPIIPCLRYADAPAAIEFLCEAFGFTKHAVHTDGAIAPPDWTLPSMIIPSASTSWA